MQNRWQKNTVVFLLSQTISLLGSSLVQYAITWYITRTTQSGVYAMLSIVFGFLPSFFLSPFAGVWADRFDRKKLIIVADAGIALSTLMLALVFMAGHKGIWLMLIASALRSVGSAVQSPAVNAMLPDIVPQEHLTRVNGINQTVQSMLMLLSPMLAALMLEIPVGEPLVWIFFVDVITAALAIFVMFSFFHAPARRGEALDQSEGYLDGMKAGWRYIISQPYLKMFFLFATVFFFMMAPAAFLTQLQVVRTFGEESWRLAAIESAFSIGMLLGGVLISTWQGFRNRVHTIALAGGVMGLCTLLLGLPSPFVVYNIYMGAFGLAMPLYNTPAVVLLQERVEPTMMGRVFGVMNMISSSVMPLGMLLFGPLADIIPIEWILIATGIVIMITSLMVLRSRVLVAAGAPQAQGEAAQ